MKLSLTSQITSAIQAAAGHSRALAVYWINDLPDLRLALQALQAFSNQPSPPFWVALYVGKEQYIYREVSRFLQDTGCGWFGQLDDFDPLLPIAAQQPFDLAQLEALIADCDERIFLNDFDIFCHDWKNQVKLFTYSPSRLAQAIAADQRLTFSEDLADLALRCRILTEQSEQLDLSEHNIQAIAPLLDQLLALPAYRAWQATSGPAALGQSLGAFFTQLNALCRGRYD